MPPLKHKHSFSMKRFMGARINNLALVAIFERVDTRIITQNPHSFSD
ncbi:hypothetical protein PL10110_170124 [Planktothrix agardhii]|nr:hypothetical protein PL10110_170124 [Planktothrix agardhii]